LMARYFALFGGFFLFCATLFAYNHRNDDGIVGLLRSNAPPKEIKFDNGSVRDLARDAASAPKITSAEDALAPGAMRKCVRKQEILYTDKTCPAGTMFASVQGGAVNVVESNSVPKEKTKSDQGRDSLRDALYVSGNANIKEKMMERAINR
jgi:hypothetical protein